MGIGTFLALYEVWTLGPFPLNLLNGSFLISGHFLSVWVNQYSDEWLLCTSLEFCISIALSSLVLYLVNFSHHGSPWILIQLFNSRSPSGLPGFPLLMLPGNPLKGGSWSNDRVYFICFLFLGDHCPSFLAILETILPRSYLLLWLLLFQVKGWISFLLVLFVGSRGP